ncbi:hypothetical protein ACJX0J_020201, partial [Zea mays]
HPRSQVPGGADGGLQRESQCQRDGSQVLGQLRRHVVPLRRADDGVGRRVRVVQASHPRQRQEAGQMVVRQEVHAPQRRGALRVRLPLGPGPRGRDLRRGGVHQGRQEARAGDLAARPGHRQGRQELRRQRQEERHRGAHVDVGRQVQRPRRRPPPAVQRLRGGHGPRLHSPGLGLRLAHDPERSGSRMGSGLELLEMRRRT